MCEYVYENGKKCRLKPVEGSRYCPLHIPYDEGESLLGEGIKELKAETFKRRLKVGQSYFEGVYLYDVSIKDYRSERILVFKNSQIKSLVIEDSNFKGLVLLNSTVDRVILFQSKVEVILVKGSTVFGLNVLRVDFSSNISIRDSSVKYLMVNSTQYVGEREEETYGGKSAKGLIELSNLRDVRRIGINSRYPLLRKILEEHGVNVSEAGRRMVKVRSLVIRDVSFDTAPRFKRQVRLSIAGFSGNLVLENLDVFGHVEVKWSHLKSPEFVHVFVHSNLIIRKSQVNVDSTWIMTVLPSLPLELTVEGFMIIEDCRFNNPYAEEVFYRLARTSWERSGDFERADQYYYLEMVARRKARLRARRKGIKKLVDRFEVAFEWLFADLTCKYGTDWKRPIMIWLFAVNVLFPVLFFVTGSVQGLSNSLSFLDYEYFSIVTATTLGYGDYHPIGVGRVIASVEALFGMFMWAVFLTVFARKYMR
ncbi:potassium channel family protein [Thermococcus henrietii]|uniref:potassium channel family protein n=1 Tax=Thermococcus henrietii TaxID=2016361 RepID=UPI000C086257|nr:potassium channel family protein [Thermococcus henrietii]